jgi:hypothetical protein
LKQRKRKLRKSSALAEGSGGRRDTKRQSINHIDCTMSQLQTAVICQAKEKEKSRHDILGIK